MAGIKTIEKSKEDSLVPLRHSAEHVLHSAMISLYPDIKLVMGPPIKDGFYFDFDLDCKITPENFPKIEDKMKEIIKGKYEIKMKEVTYQEAKKIFETNPYKLSSIEEIKEKGDKITICIMGNEKNPIDIDLCKGPHTKNTQDIKAFKLLSVAGAYYKGSEKNKMLQRIYGTAFDNQNDLDEYIKKIKSKKDNDHRKINQVMDIFATSDLVGKGLIMYTPNGTIIRNELRNHLMRVCKKYGSMEVDIPHMAKIELYKKSGHAEKFKGELFKVSGHYDNEYVLKPVNCPHHTQIYASRPRSYKDLPIAYVESTQQHRDEKPGAMVGLNRAVSFEIDDGHTFCTPEQIKDEAKKLIHIMQEFYEALGMWGEHWVSLSFRDPQSPEKYIGDIKDWEKAQKIILEINEEMNLGGTIMEGEAALYGPKIDIMYKDVVGNDRQLGTVQLDFAMPARFGLTYTDKDGLEKTPVMIHRAILGSYHRFIAYLLESTGGALPVWLSPVQVEIITISQKHVEYAKQLKDKFDQKDIRVRVNDKDVTVGAKIREAQIQKIPYMIIIGDNELENGDISLRIRSGEQLNNLAAQEALDKITNIYLTKSLKLW